MSVSPTSRFHGCAGLAYVGPLVSGKGKGCLNKGVVGRGIFNLRSAERSGVFVVNNECPELAGKSAHVGKYCAGEGLSPNLGCAPSARLPP